MKSCEIYRLGICPYDKAYSIQKETLEERVNNKRGDVLFLLEHPSTITIGKSGHIENVVVSKEKLRENNIKLYFIDRGGDVTYHGPGQLIGYPIIDLEAANLNFHEFIFNIEEVLIETLQELNITSYRKENYRGVWTDKGKIASIGLRIIKTVSMHGFALNVNPYLNCINYIIPCGLTNVRMTSVSEMLKQDIPINLVMDTCEKNFAKIFGYNIVKKEAYDTLPAS